MDFIDFCEEKKVIKFIAAIECVSIFFIGYLYLMYMNHSYGLCFLWSSYIFSFLNNIGKNSFVFRYKQKILYNLINVFIISFLFCFNQNI